MFPILQTAATASPSLIVYLVSIIFTLIVFLVGVWLRPHFEELLPNIFPKRREPLPFNRSAMAPQSSIHSSRKTSPSIAPKPAPTQIELDYINYEADYCRQIVQEYAKKDFWVAANQQPFPLLREDFFVHPQFSIEKPVKRSITLADLFKLSTHLLLFGNSGVGKTETLIYLLLTFAQRETTGRLRLTEHRLPILVSAPDLVDQLSASPELSLAQLLAAKLQPPHKTYINEKLQQGHFVLLFDGFNEISTDQVQPAVLWLENQVNQYPENRFIVTARPPLENEFNVDGPFTLARFDRLGDDTLKSLTEKWQVFVPDALSTLASIIQEEKVYPLAHRPLHLMMLLVVGLTTRTLPTHKTQLYAAYINAVLAFGDQEKTPPLSLMSSTEKRSVLQRVAFTIHNRHQIEVDRHALEEIVEGSLTSINEKFGDVTDIFINLILRSGLIVQKKELYRFTHLSFQEFLAAQGQDIAKQGINQLLAEKDSDPWWQEVDYFYRNLTDTSRAIDQAFMQETKDLPNIDRNQAYTLSLLVENLEDFEPIESQSNGNGQASPIFDFDLTDPNFQSPMLGSEEVVKIMVVDDTPQNLQLARFILQREKYIVIEVNSAEEGLRLIQEDKPSLILSDIQMPGMDGYEFCRRLKVDPKFQHIPFIFVTAFSRSTKEAARGLQIGADDYITRPFAPEELLARIGANVRIHQAEEAARRQATILARRNRELALLNQLQKAVTASLNLDHVLDATMEQVQKVLKAETTSLWFVDRANQALLLSAAFNQSARSIHGIRLPLQEGMSGYVVRSGQPFLSGNIQEHPKYQRPMVERSEHVIHSMICVPLRVRQRVIGVLQAVHPEMDHFTQEDLHLLNAVGDAVTVAIENAWLFGQIQLFNQQLEQKVEARTRELAREKEKTETILISIADSLLVTDPNNKIIMANRAAEELLEFKLVDAVGKSVDEDRFNTPLWQFVRDINAEADPSVTVQIEVPDETNQEGILAVQAHAAKMWDNSEETYLGNVIVLRDVTALQEVDRMKARFMTGITHELKTPLAIMTLHISSLLKYKLDENKKREMIETIQRQANLLERLVENILELSRLDSDMQIFEREPIDLVALSRQITGELEPLTRKKGLQLNFNSPKAPVIIDADPDQLERVIRNLVDNAIKYTKEGSITVSLSIDKNKHLSEQAILQISDTGIGLSKEQISKLFERFYRADPSHNIPGTGLGLSIAKEITKKHNGDIEVESELGRGSTFTVYLPLTQSNHS